MAYKFYTLRALGARYDESLRQQERAITWSAWKRFMLEDNVANEYFDQLYEKFTDFLFYIFTEDDTTLVGMGRSIPIYWNGKLEGLPREGWDSALRDGCHFHGRGRAPNTLCALEIVLSPAYTGKGISQQAILYMKSLAEKHQFKALIAPVRPNMKHLYPLTPLERYLHWRQANGEHFDAWIRVHERVGGQILRVCDPSMKIIHPVADWEEWTGMKFPDSGQYVVQGALRPISINLEQNEGRYIEPNVWMLHSVNTVNTE